MRRLLAVSTALILLVAGPLNSKTEAATDPKTPQWVAALYVDARNAVGLRWSPVPGATEYTVLRSETSGSGYEEIAKTAHPQHFDENLSPGHTYHYVLRVVEGEGAGSESEERSVSIPGKKVVKLQPPVISRSLPQSSTQFKTTTYKVSLFWESVPGAIAYNVYRSTTKGENYEMVASVPENQFFDTTVEGDTTYYYALSAIDASFEETEKSPDKEVLVEKKVVARGPRRVTLKLAGRAAELMWFVQNGASGGDFDFKEPTDVAFSDATNQVVAVGNSPKMIYVLDGDSGELDTKFGGKGTDPGQFLDPVGLDLDADGNAVVVDRRRRVLVIYTLDGTLVREIVLPGSPPEGMKVQPELRKQPRFQEVAVHHETGDFYVVDSGNNRIWVLDGSGAVQRIWGTPGYEVGQLNGPLYVRFDPEGNLVTANLVSTRISTFTRAGEHLRSFGAKKAAVGTFVFMAGFDFDSEGNVVVLDKSAGTLQGFLPDGRYLYHVGNEDATGGASLYTPKSVAISKDNRAYVVEGLVDIVKCFRMTGPVPEPQEPPPSELSMERGESRPGPVAGSSPLR